MTFIQIMGTSLPSGLKLVQSYVSPSEFKALDKKANSALMSRSAMTRKILADTLNVKN